MQVGDLVRYTVWSSQWHNMLGIVTEISPPHNAEGSITHVLVQFQNGMEMYTNDFDLEVING